jgi:hypothetical protein
VSGRRLVVALCLGAPFLAAAGTGCIVVEQGAPRKDAGSAAAAVADSGAVTDGSATCVLKSTEARPASSTSEQRSGADWAPHAQAAVIDGNNANCDLKGAASQSDTIVIGTFGLNVPAAAKVVGIEFKVAHRSGAGVARDADIKLWLRGIPYADRGTSVPWDTTLEVVTYGGPTDSWGASLVGADVNDPTFALGVAAAVPNAGPADTAMLDGVTAKVFYCE